MINQSLILRSRLHWIFKSWVLLVFLGVVTACSISENSELPFSPTLVVDNNNSIQETHPQITLSLPLEETGGGTTAVKSTVTNTLTATPSSVTTSDTNDMDPLPKVTATSADNISSITSATPTLVAVRPSFSELPGEYLLGVTTGYLWHPDYELFTEKLPIRIASWSPTGDQVVGWDSLNNTLSILELATGEIQPLADTEAWYSFPQWSPDGEYLLYTSPSDSNNPTEHDQIVVYALESNEITYSISGVNVVGRVVWSPVTFQFAYIAWEQGQTGEEFTQKLFVVDVDTGHIDEYPTHSIGVSTIDWSPNGHGILLYSNNVSLGDTPLTTYGYQGLYLLELESATIRSLKIDSQVNFNSDHWLYNGPGIFAGSSPWSPDGEKLVYSDRGELCILSVEKGEEQCPVPINQAVTQSGAIGVVYPSWSPDTEWIAFTLVFEEGLCDVLAVTRPDGSDLRYSRATEGDCASFGAIWSPRIP